MSDRSKSRGSGGGPGGNGASAGPGGVDVRPAADRSPATELIDRGLRLYASGDLEAALAVWRRALAVDTRSRRARDYVTYVEDHYDVLHETFRIARERRGRGSAGDEGGPQEENSRDPGQGSEGETRPGMGIGNEAEAGTEPRTEIEIEADDPMEDIDPYESMVLEAVAAETGAASTSADAPARADDASRAADDDEGEQGEEDDGEEDDGEEDDDEDEDGDDDAPEPSAPHVRGAEPGGKHGARRRPWRPQPVLRESDESWSSDESWPGGRNDTIEMALDPRYLDEIDEIAIGNAIDGLGPDDDDDDGVILGELDGDEAQVGGIAPADQLGDRGLEAAGAEGEGRVVEMEAEPGDDDELAAVGSDGHGEGARDEGGFDEPGTGEITLPARRPRISAGHADVAAEGSGLHDPPLPSRSPETGASSPLEGEREGASGPRDGERAEAGGSRPASPSSQLDLSDFDAPRTSRSDEEARAEEEAWADGTPVVPAGSPRAAAREEELREVRVTFRRPSRGMTAVGDDPASSGELRADGERPEPEATAPQAQVPILDLADTLTGESDDRDRDDDELDPPRADERRFPLRRQTRTGDVVAGDSEDDLGPAEDLAAEELPPDDDLGASDDLIPDGDDDLDDGPPPEELGDFDPDDADDEERTAERRVAAARAGRRGRMRAIDSSAPPTPRPRGAGDPTGVPPDPRVLPDAPKSGSRQDARWKGREDDALLFSDEQPRLRPRLRPHTTDLPLDARPTRARTTIPPADADPDRLTTELRRRPTAHSAVSIELVSSELMAELDTAMAATAVGGDEHVRERVGWLIERAQRENRAGRYPAAVVAVDLALAENPESAVAQKLIHSNRELLYDIYGNYLGDMNAVPGLALPMTAIPELDHRAAFLLSRVDGVLSLEDVLDVAGMARLEAFRHLSRLMLRGILEIRP